MRQGVVAAGGQRPLLQRGQFALESFAQPDQPLLFVVELALFGLHLLHGAAQRLLAELQVSRLHRPRLQHLAVRRLLARGLLAVAAGLLADRRQIDALGDGQHLHAASRD